MPSRPVVMSKNAVYTHLISDHLHYFENGGAGYANAFDSWDFIRGQEYDAEKALVSPPIERYREKFDPRHYPLQDVDPGQSITRFNVDKVTWKKSRAAINGDFLKEEKAFPTAKCFAAAFDFLELNEVVAQNVPYSADGNAVKDLKSGVLDFSFINVGNYIQDKDAFNIMLVLSELPGAKASYDGAPSIVDLNIDLGLSGLAPMGWTWWIVHADTPDDVADRLRGAMAAAMARDDVKAAIDAVGFVPLEWDHSQYDEIIGPVSGQLSAMGNALAWEEEELKKLQ